jgi:hypothetical protein
LYGVRNLRDVIKYDFMQGGFAHAGYSIIPETEGDDEKAPALQHQMLLFWTALVSTVAAVSVDALGAAALQAKLTGESF